MIETLGEQVPGIEKIERLGGRKEEEPYSLYQLTVTGQRGAQIRQQKNSGLLHIFLIIRYAELTYQYI
jgi:hypothetical protein